MPAPVPHGSACRPRADAETAPAPRHPAPAGCPCAWPAPGARARTRPAPSAPARCCPAWSSRAAGWAAGTAWRYGQSRCGSRRCAHPAARHTGAAVCSCRSPMAPPVPASHQPAAAATRLPARCAWQRRAPDPAPPAPGRMRCPRQQQETMPRSCGTSSCITPALDLALDGLQHQVFQPQQHQHHGADPGQRAGHVQLGATDGQGRPHAVTH